MTKKKSKASLKDKLEGYTKFKEGDLVYLKSLKMSKELLTAFKKYRRLNVTSYTTYLEGLKQYLGSTFKVTSLGSYYTDGVVELSFIRRNGKTLYKDTISAPAPFLVKLPVGPPELKQITGRTIHYYGNLPVIGIGCQLISLDEIVKITRFVKKLHKLAQQLKNDEIQKSNKAFGKKLAKKYPGNKKVSNKAFKHSTYGDY